MYHSGATRLYYFYEILSVCTRLQVAFEFLVWSLSGGQTTKLLGFSQKFSIAPSGETTDRIKKLGACKNGTDLLYHTMPSMVGIVGRAPAVDEKVWCFLKFFYLFVMLSNKEVCDNRNAIKQCNFQNNYGVIA